MSDDNDETASAEPAAPPGPKPPKVVLGLLGANLALSGFILFKVLGASTPHGIPAAHAAPESTHREVTGPLVALEPFVVNLNEPGSPRYLKIQIQAEVRDAADVKVFDKSKTIVHDDILGYLSGLRVAETLGADNKDRIRTDLARLMGKVIGEDRVRRIVFAEFVVQ